MSTETKPKAPQNPRARTNKMTTMKKAIVAKHMRRLPLQRYRKDVVEENAVTNPVQPKVTMIGKQRMLPLAKHRSVQSSKKREVDSAGIGRSSSCEND
jgi:hypothetical protein